MQWHLSLSRRIDAFELWCWRRLFRVLRTARRSTQSILKEISLGCSLEGIMLKLKLQYFGHLMRRVDSLEKTLMLGGIEGRRRRGRQRIRRLDGITDSTDVESDSATQWTAAYQASLSITNSWSLLKLMSTESVMPSNHLILCRPLLFLPSIFPSIGVFSNESVRIRWPSIGASTSAVPPMHIQD